MSKEYYTERLKFLTEVFKLAWLSILGVGGGSVGLLLGSYDPVRYAWAGAGIVLVLVFHGNPMADSQEDEAHLGTLGGQVMIPALIHILLFAVLLSFPCLVWYIVRDV